MICILDCLYLTMKSTRSGTRVGSGYGSKQVRVKKGQLNKGLFWFGSKRVRVGTGSGQNGFRVGSVKKMFFFSQHNNYVLHLFKCKIPNVSNKQCAD
ncbi:hypothetical protein HanHA300_Chr08g0288021 [Helianthus annuus]|nr:hypothetical protein HanHA300_Chr08g0288021 [Helianthus annuus]KAJ0547823.1 hypothetical protein HanIR_Chr08g0376531 [Helianthus annuus]KAJ0554316.1 hypothetical protein HanHA89_Chr08g0306361 [Helianthus annuus]KAJ0719911.1 hypothetical protein HanLR1_Chr08g0287071 [Helianthus annuus]KAJ0723140.1 hypothetical protein HanOQP8_Chr08g0294601 [Helianthus annuus]